MKKISFEEFVDELDKKKLSDAGLKFRMQRAQCGNVHLKNRALQLYETIIGYQKLHGIRAETFHELKEEQPQLYKDIMDRWYELFTKSDLTI